MKFSIIIPTYNREDDLCLCLDCLAHYFESGVKSSLGIDLELIVSDDAYSLAIEERLSVVYPWIRYVEGPSKGPAANRNSAARNAQGEWLVFTDDDCLPQKGWLEAFVEKIDVADVLEGKTIADRSRQRLDEEAPINETGGYLWSCNFAIKKALFDKLGGFDENFPYAAMEDVDFRIRLEKRGINYLFVNEALVVHPWRLAHIRNKWKRFHSSLYYWKKHPDKKPENLCQYWLLNSCRYFYRDTLKGCIKYSGRGIVYSISQDFMNMYLFLRLFFIEWFKLTNQ